jgi:dihydrodipicolinate synthase/N-acetylneuraminate lyase
MLSLGAEAHTTSEASAIPEPFIEILRLFQEGDRAAALQRQFDVIRLSRTFPRTDNGEYAAEEKHILSIRGICGDQVNPLYRRLTAEEGERLRSRLRDFGFAWA